MSRLRLIRTVRRAVVIVAVAACAASALAACASSSKSSAAAVAAVSVTSPASDRAVGAFGSLPVRVHVTGTPKSVTVTTGGRTANLARSGGSDWSASIPAATWLKAGRNTLLVSAVGANGGSAQASRIVYRTSTAADLGLQASEVNDNGQLGVRISSTAPADAVTVALNGQDLTSRIRLGTLNQTIYLGSDEGLKPGSNTFTITAADASGAYQTASVALTVSDRAPIAAATTEPGPATTVVSGGAAQDAPQVRVGQVTTLDGTQSTASQSGSALAYAWSVAQAPPGSKAAVTHPSQAKASFTPDVAGSYLLKLTVKQAGQPATSSDTTPILALANVPPIGDVLETQAPGGIYFDGTTYPPDAGQPLQLMLIDRSSVASQTFSGGATAASISALGGDISAFAANSIGDGVVEVLSSPAGYQCAPIDGGCAAFESLLQTLGVDSASSPSQNDATIHGGLPFSTISVTSTTTTSVWRTSATPAFAAPLLPGATVGAGNLGGYLEYPLGAPPLLFVPDTSQAFTTSYSNTATANIMRIGSCLQRVGVPPTPGLPPCQTFASATLATCGAGPTGGFQVVVLWAASLAPIANQTFTTNSGCGAEGVDGDAAQLAAMLALVAPYVSSGGTKDYLVAVQSIGSPRAQTSSAAVDAAWTDFGTSAVVPLGGTGSTFDFLGYQSGYALLGYSDTALPGFGAPYAAETSGDAPHQAKTPLPAVLNGVLARNQRNDYYPQTYGPISGAASDGLSSIVTRPPTAWPAEDTPGELIAWQDFTTDITLDNDINWGPATVGACWGLDHTSIRDIFCNLTDSGDLTVIPTKSSFQPGRGYTQDDWNAVVNEFTLEQGLVVRVKEMLANLEAPFSSGAGSNEINFTNITTAIANELKTPTTTPLPTVWSSWLGLFGDITSVVGGFVGAGDGLALAGAFLNALSQGLNVGSAFIPGTDATSQSLLTQKVQGDWNDVETDMPSIFSSAVAGLMNLEPLIVTDFGKLVAAANVVQTAPTLIDYSYSITRAANAWGTPLLIAPAYQPDALVAGGNAVNSAYQYANGPYVGDANNFSCYSGSVEYGMTTFAPFTDTAPGGEYLAGSPTQRYVLASAGDPSDNDTIPTDRITPDQPPASVLAPLFAPITGVSDTTDLGLSEAQFYERDLGLGTGTTVTCPVSPGLPTGALAATSPSPGDLNVFYTFEAEGSTTATLDNDYVDSSSGVWHGPGGLPGTPDVPSVAQNGQQNAPLAAVSSSGGQMHLFFLQAGKLVNDYDIGSGWQGPGPLPGTPNDVNSGGGLAAASAGGADMHVFFWQGTNLVYDQYANGQWTGPTVAVPDAIQAADESTPLAAVSTSAGAVTVYYVSSTGSTASIMQATDNGSTWSLQSTVVNGVDNQTPLAATTDGNGHPTVLYTSGGGDTRSSTTLMSSTDDGNGWVAATVAGGQESPLPSVAATTALPNGMTAFVLPSNGQSHNSLNSYGWDPAGGWAPGATAPVPFIMGTFPA